MAVIVLALLTVAVERRHGRKRSSETSIPLSDCPKIFSPSTPSCCQLKAATSQSFLPFFCSEFLAKIIFCADWLSPSAAPPAYSFFPRLVWYSSGGSTAVAASSGQLHSSINHVRRSLVTWRAHCALIGRMLRGTLVLIGWWCCLRQRAWWCGAVIVMS